MTTHPDTDADDAGYVQVANLTLIDLADVTP